MSNPRRPRIFVSLIAALLLPLVAAAAERPVGTGPGFKGKVGLQLYSLRGEFLQNVPATLKKVQDFGIKYVELASTYNLSPQRFKELLDAHGLIPVSGMMPFERLRDDIEGVAAEAKVFGLEYVGCAWIPHEGEFSEKDMRHAIEVFNRAGKALAPHGLKFFYHLHGYEFRPHQNGTLADLMMAETNPEFVRYQMDVYWIIHPGQDPVKLLQKYPRRWDLMHLKDKRKGAPGDATGRSDVSDNVALGTGQMNWPVILRAAQDAGIKYYFVEDESPTAEAQIPQSLRYLESLKW